MAGNNLHVSDGVGVINTPTITGIRAVGNNIIQCDSLTHFPTGKFYATTYGTKADASGNTVVDESTIQDFVGTALNNQITIISFAPGYTDKGNKAGDYVVVKPTAASANDVADRLDTTVYDHALASVNNENLSLLSPGVVSGLAITAPASGTTVSIGGSLTVVDEAIVADTNGKKSRIVSATKAATQLNIAIPSMTSGQSVNIAIIAHKAATANNGTWAYVAVPGTPATAGSQQPPTKSQIESVVPSGANGQFYAIIATAIVPQGSSSITQDMLSINNATMPSQSVAGATMIDYVHQNNTQSDIPSGWSVNGSALFFKNLDPDKKYLVKYISSFGVYHINVDASSTTIVQWSNDGNSWNNFGEGSLNTVRAASSGADDVCRTHNADICFSGKSQIYLRVDCLSSNGILRYDGGNTTAELYQVPNGFIANI